MFANKYIWFLWFQGEKNMPPLVHECLISWKQMNPGWKVIILDERKILEYTNVFRYLSSPKISFQSKSDILRIQLLHDYGGVWVDATLLCTKPIDAWLSQYIGQGFFAFSNSYRGTLISSWFLAAEQKNYIVDYLQQDIIRFWNIGYLMPQQIIYFYQRVYNKLDRLFPFFHESLKKILFPMRILCGVYPYLSFHYLFDRLYRKNKRFKEIWDRVPKASSKEPQRVQFFGLDRAPTNEIKKFIDKDTVGVHKLNWKVSCLLTENPDKNTLSYLISQQRNKYKNV